MDAAASNIHPFTNEKPGPEYIHTHESEAKQVKYNPRLGPGNQGYFLGLTLRCPRCLPSSAWCWCVAYHMWSLQLAATQAPPHSVVTTQ